MKHIKAKVSNIWKQAYKAFASHDTFIHRAIPNSPIEIYTLIKLFIYLFALYSHPYHQRQLPVKLRAPQFVGGLLFWGLLFGYCSNPFTGADSTSDHFLVWAFGGSELLLCFLIILFKWHRWECPYLFCIAISHITPYSSGENKMGKIYAVIITSLFYNCSSFSSLWPQVRREGYLSSLLSRSRWYKEFYSNNCSYTTLS